MAEVEIIGAHDARNEESQEAKNLTWQMRCTASQKEMLQQLIYASGQSASEFLISAAKDASPKSKSETELEKDLSQVDSLIERLTQIIKAKVTIAHEVQKCSQEEKQALHLEREKVESELLRKSEEAHKEILENKNALKHEFTQKEHQWEKTLKDVDKAWNEKWLLLKEVNERLESDISQKTKDIHVREKQYADSVRLHDNIEEKNFELKSQNETLKKELTELRNYKNVSSQTLSQLEKQVSELIHQQEMQKRMHEEEKKRLNSEYELKCKIAEFEIEKRIRQESRHSIPDELESN